MSGILSCIVTSNDEHLMTQLLDLLYEMVQLVSDLVFGLHEVGEPHPGGIINSFHPVL